MKEHFNLGFVAERLLSIPCRCTIIIMFSIHTYIHYSTCVVSDGTKPSGTVESPNDINVHFWKTRVPTVNAQTCKLYTNSNWIQLRFKPSCCKATT